jgi:hypothetical protein
MGSWADLVHEPAVQVAWSCAEEILGTMRLISKIPFERLNKQQALHTPMSWGAECGVFMQGASKNINMINAKAMVENCPILEGQKYIVDLETNVSRAVATL